jgi:nucleotide-binding universal stress UspA family protein
VNFDRASLNPGDKGMINSENPFNKNILIAVDESENARRAVSYVSQILADTKGFKIFILNVIREPEADYFATSTEKEKWLGKYKLKINAMLEDYRQMLLHAGFDAEDVSVRSTVRYCPSLAECILAERYKMKCSTIVLGRQGLSRSEEFLFGSVSSKIVNHARNCTVWVVE